MGYVNIGFPYDDADGTGHAHGGHSQNHGGQGASHAGVGHSDPRDSDGFCLNEGGPDVTSHINHAHTRHLASLAPKPSRFSDLNILGVLIHILGDAVNSVAVSKTFPLALTTITRD